MTDFYKPKSGLKIEISRILQSGRLADKLTFTDCRRLGMKTGLFNILPFEKTSRSASRNERKIQEGKTETGVEEEWGQEERI